MALDGRALRLSLGNNNSFSEGTFRKSGRDGGVCSIDTTEGSLLHGLMLEGVSCGVDSSIGVRVVIVNGESSSSLEL